MRGYFHGGHVEPNNNRELTNAGKTRVASGLGIGYVAVIDDPIHCAVGAEDMVRSCVLICALFLGIGCASDGDKAMWEGVLKDLRGDNMQMRSGFSEMKETDEYRSQSKYRD
jgi:hypothetical protein